jgi:hypothetical protein
MNARFSGSSFTSLRAHWAPVATADQSITCRGQCRAPFGPSPVHSPTVVTVGLLKFGRLIFINLTRIGLDARRPRRPAVPGRRAVVPIVLAAQPERSVGGAALQVAQQRPSEFGSCRRAATRAGPAARGRMPPAGREAALTAETGPARRGPHYPESDSGKSGAPELEIQSAAPVGLSQLQVQARAAGLLESAGRLSTQ